MRNAILWTLENWPIDLSPFEQAAFFAALFVMGHLATWQLRRRTQ